MSLKRKSASEEHEASESEIKKGKSSTSNSAACTLDSETQDLVEFIFDNDMFKEIVENFELDVKKMPLDNISIPLIAKAFDLLELLERAVKDKKFEEADKLSSKFLSIVPHKTLPAFKIWEDVQNEFDLLHVLADIEIAQKIKKDLKETEKFKHDLDVQYDLLNSEIKLMDTTCKEYKAIMKYIKARRGNLWRGAELRNIWTVNRQNQGPGFTERSDLQNRRLLWYCPNVASTVAILKTGLHIKPHNGGTLGQGIYFSDTVTTKAVTAQFKGILFLCEVALGNPYRYRHCGVLSWASPPEDYDSVIGVGQWGPDEKSHGTIQLDGNDVAVPYGKVKRLSFEGGSYSSQFVIYNEDLYCIRYILLFDNV